MASKKNPSGKKQAPMARPNSAAYKKMLAAKGEKPNGKDSRKNKRKPPRYSTLKSRQLLVERLKRKIWGSAVQINDAIITLAAAGNVSAAKALFDFAGVYELPAPEDESPNAASADAGVISESASLPATEPATAPAAEDPMDAFFRSIGVPPSCAEPEPEMAAAGL